jgi:uncharacterized membrane protein
MRLTWKDGITTLLVVAVVLVAMAVIQEWGWPLLGSYRAGGIVLLVLGMAMCTMSGSTQETSMRSPYTMTASILGVLALVLAIWTVIADTQAPLVALTIDIVLLWLVSTLHHVVASPSGRHAAMGTG